MLHRTDVQGEKNLYLLPAGSARRAAQPVLFLLTGRFFGFHPARATRCTDQNHQGELSAKFHLDRFRGVGLRPAKL